MITPRREREREREEDFFSFIFTSCFNYGKSLTCEFQDKSHVNQNFKARKRYFTNQRPEHVSYKGNLEFLGVFTKGSKKKKFCFDRQKSMLYRSPQRTPTRSKIAQQVPVLLLPVILCFVSQSTSRQEFAEVDVF